MIRVKGQVWTILAGTPFPIGWAMLSPDPARRGPRVATTPDIDAVEAYLLGLQDRLCDSLETQDGTATFGEDRWDRPEGGSGRSRVLEGGEVVERGGVLFSHVHGDKLPATASARRPELAGRAFRALGCSVVIHPRNPYVPTSHMNLRLFVATHATEAPIWWFGGGFDLTPYYGFKEDVVAWHTAARDAVAPFGDDLFPRLKKWCDDYFYLPHRQEPRGVGGLFFDDWSEGGFENSFAMVRSVGDAYHDAYLALVAKRKATPWGEREKAFQKYRRGRYVEFNLVYDRGTLFGLQSGGRTESILASMPPEVSWRYDWRPEAGSPEAELYEVYLKPCDWVAASG